MVDQRFVFGDAEREHFRMFMRIYEIFSGCRVLCVLLRDVEPFPRSAGGADDAGGRGFR